ncbi:MAG: tRNA lysidine(34) synthetase TilS [Planctomycetaceae bacterium]|nr:tRNA lysidine(34) synthetase TilS [Planctomycetaceae bacterium]
MPEDLFRHAMRRILDQAGTAPTVVLALSGGVDSMVLVHLADRFRNDIGLGSRQLVAAHLDHGLRGPESDGDREHCRTVADRLGLAFRERRVDAAAFARENSLGVEEAGRLLRYRFFRDIAGDDGLVLTGHHAGDQAETILLNLRRGAHRRGLSGMRELSRLPLPPGLAVRVGRPLLAVRRERLLEYAARENLSWREDHTNEDVTYRRNHFRHKVIPLLEHLMPGFQDSLLAQAERLSAEETALAEAGRDLAETFGRREGGGRALLLRPEVTGERERYLYALRHIVEEELGARLPYGAVLSRIAEVGERGRIGETVSLPGNLRVRRESDGLFFFFPDAVAASGDGDGEVILPDPPFDIAVHGFRVTVERRDFAGTIPDDDRADPEVEWLREDSIRWPLRVRTPAPGERFRAIGAPGSRKIHDILMDLKVPRRLRQMPRLLADHAGGVWLWPFRLANRVRLPNGPCRALRVAMRRDGTILDGSE